jgi:hypothetical protein
MSCTIVIDKKVRTPKGRTKLIKGVCTIEIDGLDVYINGVKYNYMETNR